MPSFHELPSRQHCTQFLSYDAPVAARAQLLSLAAYAGDTPVDQAGSGILVDRLEERVRTLLGKEAAVFMPSGKTAQNIALRLWCDRTQSRTVALHPQSHTGQWEESAYAHVFGLRSIPFGETGRQVTIEDVRRLPDRIGAASIELALRPLGCLLVPWDELVTISKEVRSRGIALHGDCARIWESQPHYSRTLADIAACFDSVYVSMYKSLGGLAGAVLAGPRWLIDAAKVWQTRTGQRLYRQYPYLLAALRGLEERLPLMPAFHQKAMGLAAAAVRCAGVRVSPDPPHTNAFLITVEGDPARADAARARVAEELGLWLYEYAPVSSDAGCVTFEVHIWTAGLLVSGEQLQEALRVFRRQLRSS